MSHLASDSASAAAGIDLSQFHQVFFEEAGENLERMEQLLLDIDLAAADDETLNSIFRCAHSVKGGAATFGFSDVAALTHQMETLLDMLRRHELEPNAAMVDVLLQSGDALKAQLARHQAGDIDGEVETGALLASFEALIAGQAPPSSAPEAPAPPATPAAPAVSSAPAARPTPAAANVNSNWWSARSMRRTRPTAWPTCSRKSSTWARLSR
jgi:two-component system, chemotaxis family, sensor kinase CheA